MFNTSTDWAKILFSMLLQNWLLQVLKALWTECHWLITGLLHILYSQQHSSPTFHTHTFKKNQMRFINLCTWLWTFLEAATTSSHITCPADLSITHSDFHRGSKCSTQCKSELHESVFECRATDEVTDHSNFSVLVTDPVTNIVWLTVLPSLLNTIIQNKAAANFFLKAHFLTPSSRLPFAQQTDCSSSCWVHKM